MREEVVVYRGNVRLSGTLFLPEVTGPCPGVVFIHGSGALPRSDYLQEAEAFAQGGVAALIYDKRGTGDSTGDWRDGDFTVLARDAAALLAWLRQHPAIQQDQVGIWGLSEGAWVAPLLAATCTPPPAFVITVGAPGVTSARIELHLKMLEWAKRGLSAADCTRRKVRLHLFFFLLRCAPKRLLPYRADRRFFGKTLYFNPLPYWRKMACPVLTIWGNADTIVPVAESCERITQALAASQTPSHRVELFDNADHTMRVSQGDGQAAATDAASFVPGYLDLLPAWVKAL